MSDKLERLLNLTAALIETHVPIPASRLRERVPGYPEGDEAFHRAFERDKDDLREMGIPLRTEGISGVWPPEQGYRIHKDDYYLRDPGLEPEELAALHLAANTVRLEGVGLGAAVAKLGGAAEADSRDATTDLGHLPTSPELVALFDAISRRRPASFTHSGVARTVDPHRLDYQRGHWYLSGYDHTRSAERVFRLDRLESAVEVGEPGSFERPATTEPGARRESWALGGDEPVTAELLVDADHAPWARQIAGEHWVSDEREDGSIVLRLEVSHVAAFRSFVLDFLDHAEVLGPPRLRAEIVSWLEAVA